MAIVRERYHDFGPTLAQEKLLEIHEVQVSKETVRKWMVADGIWVTRAARGPKLTVREKDRIRAGWAEAAPDLLPTRTVAKRTFLLCQKADISTLP